MFIPIKGMVSARPEMVLTYWECWQVLQSDGLLCVSDGRGGGLVVAFLFCHGDSFEEDLRWEPIELGVFVDLVGLDDEVDGVTLA